MNSLEGKAAVITGGASGIGQASVQPDPVIRP